MSWGLPKQPGMTFTDPTKSRFHLRQSLKFQNGYAIPEVDIVGTGGAMTDVESNAYNSMDDSSNYDPSLTYGRVKQPAAAAVVPHFALYDKRCLKFSAFMKQPVFDSQEETYRVRVVDIVYFLEDDTMTVMEPRIRNSGLWQGRMVKRDKIPKNDLGDFYHWKDLNVRKDLPIYGKVFHTVSCDSYTSEFLQSQGVELEPFEEMPRDPYMDNKEWRQMVRQVMTSASKPERAGKLGRYLQYDGMVLKCKCKTGCKTNVCTSRKAGLPCTLQCRVCKGECCNKRFFCVWDDRDSAHGELRDYELLYFLVDHTVSIKECHDGRGGRDPFPLLLKRLRLPKRWKDRPATFPSVYLETTEEEVSEYYSAADFVVGTTIFVLGRRFLLYDCDAYTRRYYKCALNVDQPERIEVNQKKCPELVKPLPPHILIGTAEDALQSCFSLMPKPPRKDVVRYCVNANKYLRYLCELDYIHPEDAGRRFVLSYSLADGTIRIGEIPRRNSGIMEGSFLGSTMLPLPGSDRNFPTYYTPEKFYIGAIVHVNKFRFKIIGCDLYVYRYMSANPHKFPREVVDNVRNYHMREGNLSEDLKELVELEEERVKQEGMAAIGSAAVHEPDAMERCLEALNVNEGSAEPVRPLTPPITTDNISYDEHLKRVRESVPPCDLRPLKGILKTGVARDDHQKVVCFNAPATRDHPAPQVLMAPEEGFCDRFKDPEREAVRASGICPYPPVPSREEREAAAAEVEALAAQGGPLPGTVPAPHAGDRAVQLPDLNCTQHEELFHIPERNLTTAPPLSLGH